VKLYQVLDARYAGRWRLIYRIDVDKRLSIVARHQVTNRAIYMLFSKAMEARSVFDQLNEEELDQASQKQREWEMRGKA
jgi:hypothetical protein